MNAKSISKNTQTPISLIDILWTSHEKILVCQSTCFYALYFHSSFGFRYTRKLFLKGFKKDLEDDDLYDVIKGCKSKRWGDKMEHAYKAHENKEKLSTLRILWSIFGLRYVGLGLIHLLWTLISR